MAGLKFVAMGTQVDSMTQAELENLQEQPEVTGNAIEKLCTCKGIRSCALCEDPSVRERLGMDAARNPFCGSEEDGDLPEGFNLVQDV